MITFFNLVCFWHAFLEIEVTLYVLPEYFTVSGMVRVEDFFVIPKKVTLFVLIILYFLPEIVTVRPIRENFEFENIVNDFVADDTLDN